MLCHVHSRFSVEAKESALCSSKQEFPHYNKRSESTNKPEQDYLRLWNGCGTLLPVKGQIVYQWMKWMELITIWVFRGNTRGKECLHANSLMASTLSLAFLVVESVESKTRELEVWLFVVMGQKHFAKSQKITVFIQNTSLYLGRVLPPTLHVMESKFVSVTFGMWQKSSARLHFTSSCHFRLLIGTT